ncbi:hypothetical protein MASR2M78_25830 [Treponema sp.]
MLNTVFENKKDSFFEKLASYLSHNLNMNYVSILACDAEDAGTLELAYHSDSHFSRYIILENQFSLCDSILKKRIRIISKEASKLFPEEKLFSALDVESYIGIALQGRDEKTVGFIIILGKEKLANVPIAEAILDLVAVQAAGVIERERIEEHLVNIASLPHENPSPLLRISREGRVLYCNPVAKEFLKTLGGKEPCLVPESLLTLVQEAIQKKDILVSILEHEGQYFEITTTTVADRDYVNMYAKDITERHKAEESLVTENELYAALKGIYEPLMQSNISIDEIVLIILKYAKILSDSEEGYVSIIDPINQDNIALTLRHYLRGIVRLTQRKREWSLRLVQTECIQA